MTKKKSKSQDWKTEPHQCAVCNKCRRYVEGPMAGMCIYGGPFSGYYEVKFGSDFSDTTPQSEG